MPLLYKYMSADVGAKFSTRELRFTQPLDLNDPLESSPPIRPKESTVRQALSGSERQIRAATMAFTRYVERVGTDFFTRQIDGKFGFLCLTEDEINPVMWGTYGDSYRGVALGFDADHPWFDQREGDNDPINHLRPVEYRRDRKLLTLGGPHDMTDEEVDEVVREAMFTKGLAWAFEREWRSARPLERADRVSRRQPRVHLFGYPAAALREVVLGTRCSDSLLGSIKGVLRTDDMRHVILKRVSPSKDEYRLTTTRISRR